MFTLFVLFTLAYGSIEYPLTSEALVRLGVPLIQVWNPKYKTESEINDTQLEPKTNDTQSTSIDTQLTRSIPLSKSELEDIALAQNYDTFVQNEVKLYGDPELRLPDGTTIFYRGPKAVICIGKKGELESVNFVGVCQHDGSSCQGPNDDYVGEVYQFNPSQQTFRYVDMRGQLMEIEMCSSIWMTEHEAVESSGPSEKWLQAFLNTNSFIVRGSMCVPGPSFEQIWEILTPSQSDIQEYAQLKQKIRPNGEAALQGLAMQILKEERKKPRWEGYQSDSATDLSKTIIQIGLALGMQLAHS